MAEQLEMSFEWPAAAPARPAADPPASQEKDGQVGPPVRAQPAAMPARCPVVGRPVCYYADCHHYQGGGCVHPEAARPRRRRRR